MFDLLFARYNYLIAGSRVYYCMSVFWATMRLGTNYIFEFLGARDFVQVVEKLI